MNLYHSAIIILVLLFCFNSASSGQEKDTASAKKNIGTNAYVSWVAQYPAIKTGKPKHYILNKVVEFLIGKSKERSLLRPMSLIASSPNNLTILDQGSKTIFQIEGNNEYIPHAIKKKENYFTSLVGVCSLPGGEILFTDSRLNKIYLISADKKKLKVFNNDTIKLQQPTGIAYSAINDEIWVVETNGNKITILDSKGGFKKSFGERGEEIGNFNFPTSICIDKKGDAYVVDAMNFRVQIFNKNGSFISTFGQIGDAAGFFARPKGIALDSYGNIYIVDALFHVVQIFDRNGNFLYKFGQQGREKESFWLPNGIYIDSKNYIYVADTYNSRIQIFKLIND